MTTTNGTGGDDPLTGGVDDDTIDGGAGNDTIDGGAGNDTLTGGSGNDVLYGDLTSGSILVNGDFEDNTGVGPDGTAAGWTTTGPGGGIWNGAGRTFTGDYVPVGGWSNGVGGSLSQTVDTVVGQQYTLTFYGGSYGNSNGSITAEGASGTQTIATQSDPSHDFYSFTFTAQDTSTTIRFTLTSQRGPSDWDIDHVTLTTDSFVPGNDILSGGSGNDQLFGGGGNDTLDGGADDDTLTGGDGSDLFVWDGNSDDVITDFRAGNTGTIGDSGVTTYTGDNDFVDLSGIFNAGTLAAYNAAAGTSFTSPLEALNHDLSTGTPGVINFNGVDLSGPTLTLTGITSLNTDETGVMCFGAGTVIQASTGARPIESLRPGDNIVVQDSKSPQPIRWIGRRVLIAKDLKENPKLRPVRILAGALGNGLPKRDLLVSRQHRMLVCSPITKRMFGRDAVLVAAIKLTDLPGIFVDDDIEAIEYFHLLFDQHEIVFAEGAASESLFTGREALKTITPHAREEILSIFPEITKLGYDPKPVRYIPTGKQQKSLIVRHLKNSKPCISPDNIQRSQML